MMGKFGEPLIDKLIAIEKAWLDKYPPDIFIPVEGTIETAISAEVLRRMLPRIFRVTREELQEYSDAINELIEAAKELFVPERFRAYGGFDAADNAALDRLEAALAKVEQV